ncbi:nuclear transport factor 2 family protein [Dietzia sp. NPDC055877]
MSTDIEARLSVLENRTEILELEGRYTRFFDNHEGAAWSQLFVEDGIYRAREPGGTYVSGRAALKAFCDEAPFDGLHLFHLPQITIDGDRATSRIHLEYRGVWPGEPGAPRVDMMGYYDVAYVRVDGTWLIKRRVTTTCSHHAASTAGYLSGSGLSDPQLTW